MSILSGIQEASRMLYIDPAATSVLLSSITAIVVAIGASVIIFWRKFKKKVGKTLHLDPNAGKEIEDELVVTDAEIVEETEEVAETEVKAEETTDVVETEVKTEETTETEETKKEDK